MDGNDLHLGSIVYLSYIKYTYSVKLGLYKGTKWENLISIISYQEISTSTNLWMLLVRIAIDRWQLSWGFWWQAALNSEFAYEWSFESKKYSGAVYLNILGISRHILSSISFAWIDTLWSCSLKFALSPLRLHRNCMSLRDLDCWIHLWPHFSFLGHSLWKFYMWMPWKNAWNFSKFLLKRNHELCDSMIRIHILDPGFTQGDP